MAALLGTVGSARPDRAEPPPRDVSAEVRAALERAGLSSQQRDFGDRAARATWVPRISVGARTLQVGVPGFAAWSIEVFAWVRWPLERRATRGIGDLGPLSMRRQALAEQAAARAFELARLRARPDAKSLRENLDREIDQDEACAELMALGAASEGCP
jgi:hypothetical protein